MHGHHKLNIALPTFCWCAVGETDSPPLPCIFFLLNVGHFDICNCTDLFRSSSTPLLSSPADCNTKKTVARQSAWYLQKQFLLSVSMTPAGHSHRQNDGESCACAAGPGRSHPLQHRWALWDNYLCEGKYMLLLGSNVKPSKSSLNQAAPVSPSKLGFVSSTKQSMQNFWNSA